MKNLINEFGICALQKQQLLKTPFLSDGLQKQKEVTQKETWAPRADPHT